MELTPTQRIAVPKDVLVSQIGGETVLLNLVTERYFGLDDIGTRMWVALTTSDSVQAACELLLDEYNVARDQLWHDLLDLVEQLRSRGLIEVSEVSMDAAAAS